MSRAKILWIITLSALLGLSLRYYFVEPLNFTFKHVLDAHSHLMLLGWILA